MKLKQSYLVYVGWTLWQCSSRCEEGFGLSGYTGIKTKDTYPKWEGKLCNNPLSKLLDDKKTCQDSITGYFDKKCHEIGGTRYVWPSYEKGRYFINIGDKLDLDVFFVYFLCYFLCIQIIMYINPFLFLVLSCSPTIYIVYEKLFLVL